MAELQHAWKWQALTLAYFSPSEFDHPSLMHPDFLRIADEWRDRCGFAIRVIDDARTQGEHDYLYRRKIDAGGTPPNSAHLRGCAIDCCPAEPSEERDMLMVHHALAMWQEGIWPHLGLEVATAHIHADSDATLAAMGQRPCIWPGVSR